MKRILLFVLLILALCFGNAFALPPDGTGGWVDDGETTTTDRAVGIGISGPIVGQADCSTITSGMCIDSDDHQVYRWDGDSVENLSAGGTDEIVYQANCATITNGFCIDTDNGDLYYWDGDTVELIPFTDLDGMPGDDTDNDKLDGELVSPSVAQTQTVDDSGGVGPASGTITPTPGIMLAHLSLTCSDAEGCAMTLGETNIVDGQTLSILNVSANACTFADSAGVQELGAAASLGQYQGIIVQYRTDRWVEISRTAPNGSQVVFTPASNIEATNVQAAIEEVNSERQPLLGTAGAASFWMIQETAGGLQGLGTHGTWRMFYNDGGTGSGAGVKDFAIGSIGTSIESNGTAGAPIWRLMTPFYQSADDPTVNDDVTNFREGTIWQNTTDNDRFQLVDGTDGAAVWVSMAAGEGMTNPMTTAGDIIYGGASGTPTRLAKGANNSVLGVNGAGTLGFYTNFRSDDSAAQFNDNTDATKLLQIVLDNITTGTTRTLDTGDYNSQLVLATDVDASGHPLGDDTAYNESTWNADTRVPTKNAVRDQFEAEPAATRTLTNKTLDANGTGNVLKGYGYITLAAPMVFGSAVTQQTTATSRVYGQALFADDVEANNYVEYILEVPRDLDTSVDLLAYFKFTLGGADTADHDYVITMIDIADSADNATAAADAVNLAYTADGSGASGDVETAGGNTLTGWAAALTPGSKWIIRITRDGDDGTDDASTVDSYSGPLTIRYGFTQ